MIQKCIACKQSFSWSQIVKSLLLGNQPVACRKCGAVHRINSRSRVVAAVLIVVIAVIFKIFIPETKELILTLLPVYLVMLLLFPFIARYTIKQK